MGWLFENFQILLVIGLALAAWLKNRGESAKEEEGERRAREELIRGLQESKQQTQVNPPKASPWDTRPQSSSPPHQTKIAPPPLKEIFQEALQSFDPQPIVAPTTEARKGAYADDSAPWEAFDHVDTSHSEITDVNSPDDEVILDRQRNMQERLAALKLRAAETKHNLGGARATQRRLETKREHTDMTLPPLTAALKDKRQTRRAVVLREILDAPVGLR